MKKIDPLDHDVAEVKDERTTGGGKVIVVCRCGDTFKKPEERLARGNHQIHSAQVAHYAGKFEEWEAKYRS